MEDLVAERATPTVVSREAIPSLSRSVVPDIEVRPFASHEALRKLVPSDVALSWTELHPGQSAKKRSHTDPVMLIVLGGSAEIYGATQRKIKAGDVATLPPHAEYGFKNVGSEGLRALQVAFPDQNGAELERTWTLERVLEVNNKRSEGMLKGAFFCLLQECAHDAERRRTNLQDAIRVFSDAFQTFLFARQATCRDDVYQGVFHDHLLEELDHNRLLKVSGNSRPNRDPILQATAAWFSHQMLVLDNVDKAVVNLVLETAGYHLGTIARPLFAGQGCEDFFSTHAESDSEHKEIGLVLLQRQHPRAYQRMGCLVDKTWDMLEAMTGRMAHLVRLEETTS